MSRNVYGGNAIWAFMCRFLSKLDRADISRDDHIEAGGEFSRTERGDKYINGM